MLTAYDAPMAQAVENGGADLILVGDSLGRAILGYQSENEVTLEDMAYHARAVHRVRQHIPIIVDLPYSTYETPELGLESAKVLMASGADLVKLEGPCYEVISALVEAGVPTVAHLGYTPQSAPAEGSKVVGKDLQQADLLLGQCVEVERQGAHLLVIEMVPREVAQTIAIKLSIPVIGIGCGPDVDGQVLVTTDMWGDNHAPFKFLRAFGDVRAEKRTAVETYAIAVREGSYPADSNSFHLKKSDLQAWSERN